MSTINLRVEVRTGETDRKHLEFTPGQTVEPFSVGSGGGWVVSAPGIADVHAYLYFDGNTLFVTRAGSGSVRMAGNEIPDGWVAVQVPMNIHLAGAKLAVRGPTARPPPGAFRRRRSSSQQGPSDTVVEPRRGRNVSARPSIDVSADDEKTVAQNRGGKRQSPSGGPRQAPSSAPPSPAAGARAAYPPIPAPQSGEATVMQPIERYARPGTRAAPRVAPPRTSPSEATVSAVGALPFGAMPPLPPLPPPAARGGPRVGSAQAQFVLARLRAVLLKSWKEASISQKFILVLLPFGFAAVFIMFSSPAPPPQQARGAVSTVGAHAAAKTSDSGHPVRASSKAPAAAPAHLPAKKAAKAAVKPAPSQAKPKAEPPERSTGGKTPARVAIDALVDGNYTEALRQYRALAARHPSNPAYKEAIHILREKIRQQ